MDGPKRPDSQPTPSSTPSQDQAATDHHHALGEDVVFHVRDRDGNEWNIGRLVNALLTMRAGERAKPEDERAGTDLFSKGVEVGMIVAVREMFGADAEQAFRDYCEDVDWLLGGTEGVSH